MILSDYMIRISMANKQLVIEPPPLDHSLQPCSIDLHLSNKIKYFQVLAGQEFHGIDPDKDMSQYLFTRDIGERYELQPGEFVLGSTIEYIEVPASLAARVEGRSTLGRCGLLVHVSAGFIDPGFKGNITLELRNVGTLPIVIRSSMPISQLCFHRIDGKVLRSYGNDDLGSRYQYSRGAVGPKPKKGK